MVKSGSLTVDGVQDILFLKITKLLDSTHRQVSQQFMEVLLEGNKLQLGCLEAVVNTAYRQIQEAKSAGGRLYT